jgi:hypothetical protein
MCVSAVWSVVGLAIFCSTGFFPFVFTKDHMEPTNHHSLLQNVTDRDVVDKEAFTHTLQNYILFTPSDT